MQRLILLRHGQAEHAARGQGDADRVLSARGRSEARAIGRWLAAQGEPVELALVSPAVRTRQTWAEVAPAFPETRAEFPPRFYAADPDEMLRTAEAADASSVLIVAHNPGLQVLALTLSRPGRDEDGLPAQLQSDFPPAAAAVFERAADGSLALVACQYPSALEFES